MTMDRFAHIKVSIDDRGVAGIVLNRPEKRNAFSGRTLTELTQAATTVASEVSVRAVLLSAKGTVFCAGADLGWMRDQIAAGDRERRGQAELLAGMLKAWWDIPQPVIARVQGNAFGGGLGLMAVADMVIARDGARFGLTEARLGLIPATIAPYVLARIGPSAASRMFVTAGLVGAEEARRIGLVSGLATEDGIDDAVEEQIRSVLACAPRAVSAAKSMVRSLVPAIDQQQIDRSVAMLMSRWRDPEAQEGIASFLERRPPSWSG